MRPNQMLAQNHTKDTERVDNRLLISLKFLEQDRDGMYVMESWVGSRPDEQPKVFEFVSWNVRLIDLGWNVRIIDLGPSVVDLTIKDLKRINLSPHNESRCPLTDDP